ncbi:DUF2645 family protein [Escherichia coli]
MLFLLSIKYDWMLESGESNIWNIPSVSGEDRILQAMIAAFFLLTPLIILMRKNFYAGNVRVLGICIFARYLSGLWLVAFLGTVYILLLVKSMRVVLTALIDREINAHLRLKSTLFRIPKLNIHAMQFGDSLDNR